MNILRKNQISNLPEWLPVRGFEGLYEVNCREGLVRNARTLKVLKASPDSNGYPTVGLMKDRKRYIKKVHRIVALTSFEYYGIPSEGLDVCHLDEERFDARISNLALGSRQENLNFEKAKQRLSESRKGENNYMFGKHLSAEVKKKISDTKSKKPVGAYKNGELILKFESVNEAGRNGFCQTNVSRCCLGKQKTHKGFEWRHLTA